MRCKSSSNGLLKLLISPSFQLHLLQEYVNSCRSSGHPLLWPTLSLVTSGTSTALQLQKAAGYATNSDRCVTHGAAHNATELAICRAAVTGHLKNAGFTAARCRHAFHNLRAEFRPGPAQERCQFAACSAERSIPAAFGALTPPTIKITFCHNQSFCNSTFCIKPSFTLQHARSKCLVTV